METISVIVPVYKVEKYLDRCVQSIVDQTYTNLEIILVDDGSPDNCPAMCDAWAEKDARIKVVHKENGGSGTARNVGLDIAAGEYVAFVDSDDYISPDMYQHLYSLTKNGADIAECGYRSATDDKLDFGERIDEVTLYMPEEAMREHIRDTAFRQLVWNKLYSRNVIKDIRFVDGKKIDDEFWTYRVLGNAKKLMLSARACYAYRQQAESVMHTMKIQNRLQVLEAKELRHTYVKSQFPALLGESQKSLWFSCVYQGQLAVKYLSGCELSNTMDYLSDLVKKYGKGLSLSKKNKVWLCLARISFSFVCKIRNVLGIGF